MMSARLFIQQHAKALSGFCVLLLLGLQLSFLLHHHEPEANHYNETCSVCSALSATDASSPRPGGVDAPLEKQFVIPGNHTALAQQPFTAYLPPARAPPFS
ncbi:MAG: hypothetical protein CSA49_03350 [Gammaproteobacteria bacterium]|nr:MAG: hypothetical protein CSA49_03350 [Gammaproteobacteria bacterium]